MPPFLVLRLGKKRVADDITINAVNTINEPNTSHWVRRSGRPHKAVKYFEDTDADLMDDSPENTVQATTVSKQATGKNETRGAATSVTDKAAPEVLTARKSHTHSPSPAPSSAAASNLSTPLALSPTATNTPRSSSTDYESAAHSTPFVAEIPQSAIRDSLFATPLPLPRHQPPSETSSISSLDFIDDILPCATNKYKFTSDNNSTGRTAAQLNSLFKPPPRMPRWPLDGANAHAIKLSYTQLGPRPQKGLADELVRQMEMRHAVDVERMQDQMEELIETEDEDDGQRDFGKGDLGT
jgi:hypothetical protein